MNVTISLESLNGDTDLYVKICDDYKSKKDRVTYKDIENIEKEGKEEG